MFLVDIFSYNGRMSKTKYPCQHCGTRQASPALLCFRCSPNDNLRKQYGLLTASDVYLKGLTFEERMMVFIYCATGKADFFDQRLSAPSVEDENPLDLAPKWASQEARGSQYKFCVSTEPEK